MEANEEKDKVSEEDKIKKDEEAMNNETIPMERDAPKISKDSASGMILGLGTPFILDDVPNPRKFVYYKASGKIIQEKKKSFDNKRKLDIIHTVDPHDRACQKRSSSHSLRLILFLERHKGTHPKYVPKNLEKKERIKELEGEL
jgi:hypothetical protein